MRTRLPILILALAALYVAGQGMAHGQAMVPDGAMASDFLGTGTGDAPDAQQYADGTTAIRESRWVDAVKIFDKVAEGKGPHAAGALYWKAYAESKMGDSSKVLESCAALRTQYVGSTWIDDCGALEIELKAKNGQTVQPEEQDSDELKLLALATLMSKDPTRARAQIEEIVQGDSSERLKEGALFILGQTQPQLTYPEIVRISYLEGDVRIARASKNEGGGKGATWETAVMNLPLEEGDNLVTGKDGRAEIEFEDDSTVYVAENSALNFEDLRSTSGVPHTELALVSGAVTMHLDSLMPGEMFVLHTPKNQLLTRYPQKADMRVSSYLDGTAVTPLTPGKLNIAGTNGEEQVTPDKTFLFEDGHKMAAATPEQTPDYAAFDAWVADRYSTRTADTQAVMEESGLQRPIPGLAQLKGKGAFYDCQPYGKCWEPTPKKSLVSSGGGAMAGGGVGSPGPWDMGMDMGFPCMPWAMGYDFYPGFMTFQPASPMPADVAYQNTGWGTFGGWGMMNPYAWAVCHAGYWMPMRNGRYAWVVGRRIHHRAPVRWVRTGRTVVAVPLNPRDVKGQLPLNRAFGFVPVKGKQGFRVTPVKLNGSERVELMKEAPRAYRNVEMPKLAKAEAPHMMAHALRSGEGVKLGEARAGIPLTFNRQQGFMATRQVIQGGRPVAVAMPVGRSGPVFAGRGGGGAPGFGAANGGYHGGSAGGFHGGGFSGGSAGASHGGATTASSGSISVSSASSSASAAPSSGSHK
jgi:hypothetical protein